MLSNYPGYRRARLSAAQRVARFALLADAAALAAPDTLVVPACRHARQRRVRHARKSVSRVSEIIR